LVTFPMRDEMLLYEVLDVLRFVSEAVTLEPATHFAAEGGYPLRKWFHPAARTREDPRIYDVQGPPEDWFARVACGLDVVARESVRRFIMKASTKSPWMGACLHHWCLYSDEKVLVAVWDWGMDPVQLDPSLSEWAESLAAAGVLRACT